MLICRSSIEYRSYHGGETNLQSIDTRGFSPESCDSPGSSLFGTRKITANVFSSAISSPLVQKSLRVNTKHKEKVEEDDWPELGDDLLPM